MAVDENMLVGYSEVRGHTPYGSGLAGPGFFGFGPALSPARFGGGGRSGFGRLGAIHTPVRLTLIGQIVAHINSLLAELCSRSRRPFPPAARTNIPHEANGREWRPYGSFQSPTFGATLHFARLYAQVRTRCCAL